MTFQFRGQSSPTGANAQTRTCVIPATANAGEFALLEWASSPTSVGGLTPTNAPSGGAGGAWTLLGCTDPTGTANFGIYVYAKVLAAGDIGATITVDASAVIRHSVAVGVWYDDSGAGSLAVDGSAFGTTVTPPTLNTVAAGCFGVSGAGERRSTGVETFTPPAGWTERIDAATDSSTGGKSQTVADKLTAVSAGTNLGGGAFVPSGADRTASGSWVVALKPAVAASDLGFFWAA